MPTYHTDIATSCAPSEAFKYLARFSNAAMWDPGVLDGEDLDKKTPRVGSTYRLMVRAFGRRVPLEYRIEEIDPPRRVVLKAQNATICSRDVIVVAPAPGGGSTVSYEAALSLKGPALLLSPLVGVALRHIGDRAGAGLQASLDALAL